MIDISKFVTVGEDGKPVIDAEAYKSAYDAELRKSLDTNSENTRKKLENEIRAQLEEEAKLSAEDKLKKDREDFEASMTKRIKEFAQKQAKIKMEGAGFEDDEINTYLELVSDDDSLVKIDKILEARTKREETLKKQFEESIMSNQPEPKNNGGTDVPDSIGKQMANKYQNKNQDSGFKVTAWGE